MFSLDAYLDALLAALRARFGARLTYVGLQGSALRGELTPHSDIDVMLVLDRLRADDLDAYRALLAGLDHADRACGFVCGREELAQWNPLEIAHLLHATRDLYGELSALVPAHTAQDARRYVQLGLNNLYHALCHTRVHAPQKLAAALPGLYKSLFFVMQDLHALRTGAFPATRRALLDALTGRDRQVFARAQAVRDGAPVDAEADFRALFSWCRDTQLSLDSPLS